MKALKFDGKLKWVCPHCGEENETVAEEWTDPERHAELPQGT
jgi:uncharacterized Zn finger protein (UPF0148 family)